MASACPPVPRIVQPQAPKPEVPADVIATAIVDIAKAAKAISESRLTRDAIVVLIHDRSGLPKKTINLVLNNLEELEETWLKPAR